MKPMMYRGIQSLTILFLSLFSVHTLSAQTIVATSSGPWSDKDTWNLNRIPNALDYVEIDGHNVTLATDGFAQNVIIVNSNGDAALDLQGNGITLTVGESITVHNKEIFYNADLIIGDQDSLYIGGNLFYERFSGYGSSGRCRLAMSGDARLEVVGDYIYNYQNSGILEGGSELYMTGTSKMHVGGMMNIVALDGNGIHMAIDGQAELTVDKHFNLTSYEAVVAYLILAGSSSVQIGGDATLSNLDEAIVLFTNCYLDIGGAGSSFAVVGNLNIKSDFIDEAAYVTVDGPGTTLHVGGNINFNANSEDDSRLSLQNSAKLYLAGDFNRSGIGFGDIAMDQSTTLIYNGNQVQVMPSSNVAGSGSDFFQFANVEISNTSGAVMNLTGPMIVERQLNLTQGIIGSTELAPVILTENATVVGGDNTAYVQGPFVKEGAIVGDAFTFPLGENGVYAPFEITLPKSAAASTVYTAKYSGCPPPLGSSLDENSLVSITGGGHWEFESSKDSPQVDVILHWEQASTYGITDVGPDLVVAMYDGDVELADGEWISIGQGAISADGANNNGWVSNAIGCPPPLGGSVYAFGSAEGVNPLPVVLSDFDAQPKGHVVEITWETSSEFNANYFTIERSGNGINFSEIQKVDAEKNGDNITFYKQQDLSPAKGANYYRLCQVDNMGFKVYSPIELAYFEEEANMTVFPNPVRDVMHVKGDFHTKAYQLEFLNSTGKVLAKKSIMGEKGFLQINTQELNLPESAMLFINISAGSYSRTIPFVKS